MIPLLLFLILVALIAVNIQLRELIKLQDFSKEDAQVKAMTERAVESGIGLETAIEELPSQSIKGKT